MAFIGGNLKDGDWTRLRQILQFLSTTNNMLKLKSIGILEGGSNPTKYTYLQGGDQTVNLAYTLPTAFPASIGFLKISDAGVMTTDVSTYTTTGSVLLLDQTTPQTIINGTPIFNAGLTLTATTGITLSATAGALTIAGLGGYAENLIIDFDGAAANTIYFSSGTGATDLNLGSFNLLTTGTLGAGAITGTSFVIGANTLNTTEWAFLDGQNQSVFTTSTPQFTRIGIGTPASATYLINAVGDITGTGTQIGLYLNPTATASSNFVGVGAYAINTRGTGLGGTIITVLKGLNFFSRWQPANAIADKTASLIIGGSGEVSFQLESAETKTHTITSAEGFRSALVTARLGAAGNGVITEFKGYSATLPSIQTGFSLVNAYAFYDIGQTAATNNWGFYGLSANNFMAALQIGGTATVGMGAGTLGVTGLLTATTGITIGAGTLTVWPLRFTSGTSLTTPVAGTLEFTTDDFFATITTGAARKAFILDDGARLTSGKIPIATTNGRLIDSPAPVANGTYTITGGASGAVATFTTTNGIITGITLVP